MTQLSKRHAFKVNKIPVIKQTKENDCYSTYLVRPKGNSLQLVAISELDSFALYLDQWNPSQFSWGILPITDSIYCTSSQKDSISH